MDPFKNHPDYPKVMKICDALWSAGYKAYLAGGCVRDFLLGRVPNDFDVASDAAPEQVEELFANTYDVGRAFGVIVVVEDGVQIEVTRFRADGEYLDGRRPIDIIFSSEKEDAARRDFTMNALFMDPRTGAIIDYFGGQEDIKAKFIRAVGIPQQRFAEDALRILRAYRFASQLGFVIERETLDACELLAPNIQKISVERVVEELKKMVFGHFFAIAFHKIDERQVFATILTALFGVQVSHQQSSNLVSVFLSKVQLISEIDSEKRWLIFLVEAKRLFISLNEKNEARKVFARSLRLSRDLENAVDVFFKLEAAELAPDRMVFFDRILPYLFSPSTAFFLGLLEASNPVAASKLWITEALSVVARSKGLPPDPLIKAKDLPGLTGRDLGQSLKRAFLTQLLNPDMDKDTLKKLL